MMKNLILAFFFLSFLTAFTVTGGVEQFAAALRSGNASQVGALMDANVDVTINNTTSSLNKAQAQAQVQGFFAKNAVKSFSVIHQGNAGGSDFAVGNLVTSSGTYRVTYYLKEKAGKELLQELRIEK